MISDERLEDIAKNPGNHWDRETIGTMARELLSLRQQVKEWREVADELKVYIGKLMLELKRFSWCEAEKRYDALLEKYKE
jgi:hypothetical protein